MGVMTDIGDMAVGVIQDAMEKDVQKNVRIFSGGTSGETQGALLKAAAYRLVQSKGGGLDVVRAKDASVNSFLDDLLDEVNMSEIQIKHLRRFGMVR